MISLPKYGGKSRVLLGFLLLVSVPLVRTTDYLSLNASAQQLKVGDRLVSTPNPYFEFGIFSPYNYSGMHLQLIKRSPLIANAVLQFEDRNLKLFDLPNTIKRDNIWSTTSTDNRDVVSAELLDTGKLVLINNQNQMEEWNNFDHSPLADKLLTEQHMDRKKGHSLNSWQRMGDMAIANDTYLFRWDPRGVLTLSWTCPKVFLNWKGGSYIPSPDVYAAHTIRNRDKVYFHKDLGHLYMDSDPPTAILSGGADCLNGATLKRMRVFSDGGLRILQYTINQSIPLGQTLNQRQKVLAKRVVFERLESRSGCAAFGTCGPYSECVSSIGSVEPVTCRCLGADNIATKDWFTPIDINDMAKGCQPPSQRADCPNENGTYVDAINPVGMLELPGVDMPWAGDYRNLTGNDSADCKEACVKDCYCAGAVFFKGEQVCWLKNGALYNLGYPTEALHGTDRTSYLRNQTVKELHQPHATKKDNKLVKILVPVVVGTAGVFFIALAIFCLWRYEKVRQWLRTCGCCRLCYRRPKPCYEIKFPGDTPVRDEPEDEGIELRVEEQGPRQGPVLNCTCSILCNVSLNCSGSPRI